MTMMLCKASMFAALPAALARTLRSSGRSGGSSTARAVTVTTRAQQPDPSQQQQQQQQGQQQQQPPAAAASSAPVAQQRGQGVQRRRRGSGLLGFPLMAGPSLLTSPMADIDFELQRMLNEFDDMKEVIFGHRDTVARIPDKLDFNCDILEKKKEFLITADLPGLSKDMVNITVDEDRRLHITAERAARHEEEINEPSDDVKLHVYERVYGKIERMFRLPENANEDMIEATMTHGVLTVHIAKHPPKESEVAAKPLERQIEIK